MTQENKSFSVSDNSLEACAQAADRDVMITGVGMITPLGLGAEDSWQAVISGKSAGRLLTPADIDHFHPLSELLQRVPGGAPVDHQAVRNLLLRKLAGDQAGRQVVQHFDFDCLNNLMLASVIEAFEDADLPVNHAPDPRLSCVIGTSKASLRAMENETRALRSDRPLPDQHWTNGFLADAPLRCVQQFLNATGPALCPVAACATGLVSAIQGAALIRQGLADVCIAGSVDASLRASVVAAFHRLGVTSKQADPARACRPFQDDRDGFIIGEGAGVVILESREHATRRSATAYGQFLGGCWLTDPTGLTQINSDGRIVYDTIQTTRSLSNNSTVPDIISVHGTGTRTNDLAEAQGLALAYPNATPPCFGIKAFTGHLLGAAGSVELVCTLLALRDGVVPPTGNAGHVDPDCRICLEKTSQRAALQSALKLSLGFGGHVAACQVIRA